MGDAATTLVLVQLLTLTAVGLIGCAVAQRLGTARIVGGLIAGLLIGPSLLGNFAPTAHRHLWQGGAAELRQLDDAKDAYRSAVDAAKAVGVTESYVEELAAEHLPRIASAQQALDTAEADHRRTTDGIALLAMAMLLLAAGRNAPLRHAAALAAQAVPIALGTILVPAVLAFAASYLFGPLGGGDEPSDAAVDPMLWTIGLALGCAAVALPLSARLVDLMQDEAGFDDRDAERQVPLLRCVAGLNAAAVFCLAVIVGQVAAGRSWPAAIGLTMIVVAAGAAAVIALALAGLRLIRTERPDEPVWPVGLLFAVALAPVIAAALLDLPIAIAALVAGLSLGSLTQTPPLVRRAFAQIADAIALPILCAYIGTRIDLVPQFDWLWVLVAVVVFGDGKFAGAALLARLRGSPWLPAARCGTLLAAGGPLPLILAVLLLQSAVIDQPLFVALVIANALAAAFTGLALRMLGDIAAAPPAADEDL